MEISIGMASRFRLAQLLEDYRPEPMSQSELSRRSGVSFTTINRMCANKTSQVSLATLDALSEALGVEPGELIEREGKKRGRTK